MKTLENSLPGPLFLEIAQERWGYFKDTLYTTAIKTFGKKTITSADWFKAHYTVLLPLTGHKRQALTTYKDTQAAET